MDFAAISLRERQENVFASIKSVEDLMRSISSQSKDQTTLMHLKSLLDELRDLKLDGTIPPYSFLNAFLSAMTAKKGRLLGKVLRCGQKLVENEVLSFSSDLAFRPSPKAKAGSSRSNISASPSSQDGFEGYSLTLDATIDLICSSRRHPSDDVISDLVQFLGSLVTSRTCTINDHALMKIMDTCYSVRLTSQKSPTLLQVARTTLMQIVQSVLDRLDDGFFMRKSVRISDVVSNTSPHDDSETLFSFKNEKETEETVLSPTEPDVADLIEDDFDVTTQEFCERIVNKMAADAVSKSEAKGTASASEVHHQYKDVFSVSNEPHVSSLSPALRNACNMMISFCRILLRQTSEDSSLEKQKSSEEVSIEEQGKILAYEALLSIIERRDDVISKNNSFIRVVKEHLCHALVVTSVSLNPTFFHYSLNFMYMLIEKFRIHLKTEIGVFFSEIYLRLLESQHTPDGHKIKLIQVLNRLCKNEFIVVELFLNYDNDVKEDNIFLRLVDLLTKVSLGSLSKLDDPDSENNFESFGLQALIDILASMVRWCKIGYDSPDHFPADLIENYSTLPRGREHCVEHLEDMLKRKSAFRKGLETFNLKPAKGIKQLIDNKMIENTPTSIANFLRETHLLDKSKVGEYLGEGEDFNISVLREYVEGLSFANMTFDGALRYYLSGFRLPGEAQKISRMLEIFAERFCKQNPGIFGSAETAYVLSYSVIMLNTDAHNPMVKKKMSLEEFIRNNRGIDGGKDLASTFLESLYKEIVHNEIKMKDTEEPKIPSGLGPSKKKAMLFEWEGDRILTRCLGILGSRNFQQSPRLFLLASYCDIPRLMFKDSWYSFLGTLSQSANTVKSQAGFDVSRTTLVAEGFRLSIKLSVAYSLDVEASAFINSYLKFFSGQDARNGVKTGDDGAGSSDFNPMEGPVVDEKYMKEYFPSASRMGRAEIGRLQENLEKLANIQKMCVGRPKEKIFDPMRRYLREGPIEYDNGHALKKRYLFLFNDAMLFATPVPNNIKPLFFFHKLLNLSETVIMDNPDVSSNRSLTIQIKSPKLNCYIKLASEEHKRVWFEDISKAIASSKDRASAAENEARAPLPSHLAATNCLHFDCKKEDKQKGNFKKRIIQVDYNLQKVNVAKKGDIHKVFTFHDIEDCVKDATDPFVVDIRFRGPDLYKIKLPSEKDAADMFFAFKNIIDLNPRSIPPQFKLSDCVKRGNCEKLGNRAWSLRWLLLYKKKLFIFKTGQDVFPVNILTLSPTMKVIKGEDLTLELKDESREYSLRFKSRPERDGWEAALNEAASDGTSIATNPSMVVCMNSVHVSVVKLNKRGLSQTRIIQVDFKNKRLNNILDGSVRKYWALREIHEFQTEGTTCIRIFFKDFHRYEVFPNTPQDCRDLQHALQLADANVSQALPSELLPGQLIRRGYVSLQANYGWAPRMTYFFEKRLLMFQNDFELYPTGIIQVRDIKNVSKITNYAIEIAHLKKSVVLKFESEAERDAWFTSLIEARRKITS